MSLSKTFKNVEVSAFGRLLPMSSGSFLFLRKSLTPGLRTQIASQLMLRIVNTTDDLSVDRCVRSSGTMPSGPAAFLELS